MGITPYKIPGLTVKEQDKVDSINKNWDKKRALSELKHHLQVAVEIELATIPIYLGTYYSINRTVSSTNEPSADFPKTAVSRFADKAAGIIMSVVVEEMLHMSLSSNVLYSLGQDPLLYRKAPASYPAHLPGHKQNELCSQDNDSRNIPIPLAKFSFEQLSHFLAIEYPAPADASPEPGNWDTIGQIYSYVRCIISSKWIDDSDFQVRQDKNANQIKATEYSPNSIDTVYPNASFNYTDPVAAPVDGSAAKVAEFPSEEDSHLGVSQLLNISSCNEAMEAIATICFQGEGFAEGAYDDPSHDELSHYYKFLELQSELVGYTQAYIEEGLKLKNNVAPNPKAPKPAAVQYGEAALGTFVYPAADNPVAANYSEGRKELIDIADGLFQYMLVMSETIYRVPSESQKVYFNRTMHQSMIWILDKFLKCLRLIKTADGQNTLCATFANVDLGEKKDAFATLCAMVNNFKSKYGDQPWYKKAEVRYYLQPITELPDVSVYWQGDSVEVSPAFLNMPASAQDTGEGPATPKPRTNTFTGNNIYAGAPRWPLTPPEDNELPSGAMRHACMGLNSCKNEGRTSSNACAGQGFCSTALKYNATDPSTPIIVDHTCHVLNDCRGQGGCGLYGTQSELMEPGQNGCQTFGSCATPINAERFITDGEALRHESVWVQARKVFTTQVWPGLVKANPELPVSPPEVRGSTSDSKLFQYGPTIGWIENDNDGNGMTACGSSGMSGAGSCA